MTITSALPPPQLNEFLNDFTSIGLGSHLFLTNESKRNVNFGVILAHGIESFALFFRPGNYSRHITCRVLPAKRNLQRKGDASRLQQSVQRIFHEGIRAARAAGVSLQDIRKIFNATLAEFSAKGNAVMGPIDPANTDTGLDIELGRVTKQGTVRLSLRSAGMGSLLSGTLDFAEQKQPRPNGIILNGRARSILRWFNSFD